MKRDIIVFSSDGDIVCSVDLLRQQYVFLNYKDMLPNRTKNVMYYKKRNALYCLYEYGGINAIRIICGDRSVTIDIPVFIRNICLRWMLELRLLLKQMRLTNMADTDGTIQ